MSGRKARCPPAVFIGPGELRERIERAVAESGWVKREDVERSLEEVVARRVREAVAAEREGCAVFVEDGARGLANRVVRYEIAAAIRTRDVET